MSEGTILSTLDSFFLIWSLKTLKIRMEKQCYNALIVYQYLKKNKNIDKLHFPGTECPIKKQVVRK